MSQPILLVAFNARYSHTAFGLRCLLANLGEFRERSCLCEYNISADVPLVARELLDRNPLLIALSVHIWNANESLTLLRSLKALRPDVPIILGGPEAGYAPDSAEIVQLADCTVRGEAELLFPKLCAMVERGENLPRRVVAEPPDLLLLRLPYNEYSSDDLARRVLYVETMRGCPCQCAYCLSALDRDMRSCNLELIFKAFDDLLIRGALRFKFVDRSFNVDIEHALKVLDFFLERLRSGLQLHFEMLPDRLPEELLAKIRRFPAKVLHLEVGIQTYDRAVAERIGRRCDYGAADQNIQRLVEAGADVHADLIAGLPGENLISFAAGFDRLVALQPSELQLGLLKRLHGAPISAFDEGWRMRYRSAAPYDVVETAELSAHEIARLGHMGAWWERLVNRNTLPLVTPMIWRDQPSCFFSFLACSDWLTSRFGRTHSVSLLDLLEAMLEFLTVHGGLSGDEVRAALRSDYLQGGRRMHVPGFLTQPA